MEGSLSWRHALAFLVTVSSAWLIWNFTHLILEEPKRLHSLPVIHVSLARPPAPPAPKTVPKPPPPKPIVHKQIATRAPIEPSPHPIGPPVAAPGPVTQQAPAPPAPPAPPVPPVANPSLQSTYIASVHAAIEEQKRYPMSKEARLSQPSGTVLVYIVLDRAGNLLESGIDESAGSILDRAALDTVRRTTYPPFPASVWPGDSRARLQVPIHFSPT